MVAINPDYKGRRDPLQISAELAAVREQIAIEEARLAGLTAQRIALLEDNLKELQRQQREREQDKALDIALIIKSQKRHFIHSDILFGNPLKTLGMPEGDMSLFRERCRNISPDDYPALAASSVILTYNKAGRQELLVSACELINSLEQLAHEYGDWIYNYATKLDHNILLRGTTDEAVKHMADATIKSEALINNLTRFSDNCLAHDFLEGKKRTIYHYPGGFLYSDNPKDIIIAEFKYIMNQANNKQLLMRANDWLEARIRYMEAVEDSRSHNLNLVNDDEYHRVLSLKQCPINAQIIDDRAEAIEKRTKAILEESHRDLFSFAEILTRRRSSPLSHLALAS